MDDRAFAEQVAQVVIHGILDGQVVEIDGLGSFYPDAKHFFRFEPNRQLQVFIAYVQEDRAKAERLYDGLKAAGFAP